MAFTFAKVVERVPRIGGPCIAAALLVALGGCGERPPELAAVPGPLPAAAAGEQHAVQIRPPPAFRGVSTAARDPLGQPVALKCKSCHSVRPANQAAASSADLDEFHQGLQFAHGTLTCVSCHHPADGYDSLRLADGRTLPVGESMTLCAQCHGTQFRDYQHGAHGGMTGHWDLTRGERTRNHCLHCHDPHVPKYSTFMPVAGPRDRFPPVAPEGRHE